MSKRKVYWDSSCFIAFISSSHPDEAHRGPLCEDVLENARRGDVEIWTSVFTIAEVIRRKLPPNNKPLPAWADVIKKSAPSALLEVQKLWDFHDRKTAPTKALDPSEVKALQQMFDWKFIRKIQVDELIARKAVSLSQTYGLRAPDAIHAASALAKPCDCIQAFDKDYSDIKHLIVAEEPTRITPQGALPLSLPAQPGSSIFVLTDGSSDEEEKDDFPVEDGLSVEQQDADSEDGTGEGTRTPTELPLAASKTPSEEGA